jgi:hypothetical protein
VEIDDEDEVYNRNKTQDGNYRFGNGQEWGCALRVYFPNIICIHLYCQKNH